MKSKAVAWALFILSLAHIVFGILRFKAPLLDAVASGFVGQFSDSPERRTAFWFIMCGPLLMVAGHLAIRSVAAGDYAALKIIGIYTLVASLVGIAAFPMSPLWVLFGLSLFLIAAGNNWFRQPNTTAFRNEIARPE